MPSPRSGWSLARCAAMHNARMGMPRGQNTSCMQGQGHGRRSMGRRAGAQSTGHAAPDTCRHGQDCSEAPLPSCGADDLPAQGGAELQRVLSVVRPWGLHRDGGEGEGSMEKGRGHRMSRPPVWPLHDTAGSPLHGYPSWSRSRALAAVLLETPILQCSNTGFVVQRITTTSIR